MLTRAQTFFVVQGAQHWCCVSAVRCASHFWQLKFILFTSFIGYTAKKKKNIASFINLPCKIDGIRRTVSLKESCEKSVNLISVYFIGLPQTAHYLIYFNCTDYYFYYGQTKITILKP